MLKKIILSSLLIGTFSHAQKLNLPDILKPNQVKDSKLIHSTFKRTGPTVQIGILLDTSNSMDGLINQAKDQLWKIVNEVSKANKNNKEVAIQVGLFEYGKDSIPDYEGHIQMLSPLTNDLDSVSEQLFQLSTNGGREYSGKVILESVNRFAWSTNKDDLKILIIAGNEQFTQGNVPYSDAIKKAVANNIIVNTIFCGNADEGRRLSWEDGARLGNGKYFSINHDDIRVIIQTPYDDRIIILGKKLNTTFILKGTSDMRIKYKNNIVKQDKNSLGFSKSSFVERNIMKSKNQYALADKDMVSLYMEDKSSINKIEKENLPEELQNKSKLEIKEIISSKKDERINLQKEMTELEAKRTEFLSKNKTDDNDLGSIIIKTIRTQAETNGFIFKK